MTALSATIVALIAALLALAAYFFRQRLWVHVFGVIAIIAIVGFSVAINTPSDSIAKDRSNPPSGVQ